MWQSQPFVSVSDKVGLDSAMVHKRAGRTYLLTLTAMLQQRASEALLLRGHHVHLALTD